MSSYLGVTAHFYCSKDHRRHNVTIAVHRMQLNHTGENIRELVESVLEEWEIPPSKISAILTDNGSNMISAFRPQAIKDEVIIRTSRVVMMLLSLVRDFEEKESDLEIAFSGLNRISCFAYTLQLVVHTL